MTINSDQISLLDNPSKKRFEFKLGDELGIVEYIKTSEKIFLTHTEVPKGVEGKGYGRVIVKLSLKEVERLGLKLIPLCPYVAAYIQKNTEWKRLL